VEHVEHAMTAVLALMGMVIMSDRKHALPGSVAIDE